MTQIRSFLGLANYFAGLCNDFQPLLHHLLTSHAKTFFLNGLRHKTMLCPDLTECLSLYCCPADDFADLLPSSLSCWQAGRQRVRRSQSGCSSMTRELVAKVTPPLAVVALHVLDLALLAWNECTLACRLAGAAHLPSAPASYSLLWSGLDLLWLGCCSCMDHCMMHLLRSLCLEPLQALLQSCHITLCGGHLPEMEVFCCKDASGGQTRDNSPVVFVCAGLTAC